MSGQRKVKNGMLTVLATRWNEYDQTIREAVQSLDEDGLIALERSVASVTATNCWYAEYHAAPDISEALAAERYRRKKATGVSGTDQETK